MIQDIKKDARIRMRKTLESLRGELAKIRTGRAHPSLLEHVTVDYYGSEVPIGQAASVSIEDARTLAVTAWDKNMIQPLEKAIMKSDLGLNPVTAGLLDTIAENDTRETGEQILRRLAADIGFSDVDSFIQHGLAAMEEMRSLEILIGTRGAA